MKYCCYSHQRNGSCYFEFQKGKFLNKYWNENSLCLHADIFDDLKLYKLFSEIIPEFDYYGNTEIDYENWKQVKQKADTIGGNVKDVISEIDMWANPIFLSNNVVTILGI